MVEGVRQACVTVQGGTNGDKRLVAYAVTEGEIDRERIQRELAERLPEYMVPRIWVPMERMPLTANGKLDRRALPLPEGSELSAQRYVAPRTPNEQRLARIWQELLGIDKVGIHDNFFELGGHSLLAVRLMARIRETGHGTTIRDIFAHPSIELLADRLSPLDDSYRVPDNAIPEGCAYITPEMLNLVELAQDEIDAIMDQVPGGPTNIQDIYPLSPLQQGMYFHHLVSGPEKGDPYVLPSLISFSSTEKRERFMEGLRFVIRRHDVLRTCVLSEGLSQNVQVVLREVQLPVERVQIDGKGDILAQVQRAVEPENLYIDLERAPMLRIRIADDIQNATYYLVTQHHHLMMDHLGLEKVQREIGAYLSGRQEELPRPALYRDFIGNALHKIRSGESREYFGKIFGNLRESSYPFGLTDTLGDGSTRILTSKKTPLPQGLGKGLRRLAAELRLSPATLFHAAFGIVVARLSGTEHALFGSVLLGRLQGARGSEASLGLFMNTLPVLLEPKGDLRAYIEHTNDRLQGLMEHEQTPASKVHDWSGIPNSAPMFTALLNYRHSERNVPAADATHEQNKPFDPGAKLVSVTERTNYPFSLDVDDYGNNFGITTKIIDAGIDPSTVVSYMEKALTLLIEHIDDSSETMVNQLSILTQKETHQLLKVFNDTVVDYPEDTTVVDLFEEQVLKTPDAPAIVYGEEALSYRELDQRANQLARYLKSKGAGPNVLVGACLNRGFEMIVGIMGIIKSGAAFLPIDPEYPKARIDHMLQDSKIRLLLGNSSNCPEPSIDRDMDILLLDTQWKSRISRRSVKRPGQSPTPKDMAYAIYTSGSTGKPKGVPITHASLYNFLLGMTDRLEMEDMAVLLSVTTFTFDIFYLELFAPLSIGAKVVLADAPTVRDANKLRSAIESHRPDFMQATPSTWQMLVDNGWENKEGVTVLTGGEAISESLKNALTAISNTVWNLYGPTEATIWVTAQQLKPSERVTIGRAIDNVRLYVLDNENALVPVGVAGELCIGGIQLSNGYLNRETLTSEKFLPDPFKKGGRIYKTGDLARWRTDGTIELIGRRDTQVKVRGHRIELGEIENALSLLPEVQQACVLAREDGHGSMRLVGYVMSERELDKDSLQSALQQSLPDYMVPRLWVRLEEMPLTANGKVDRRALPKLDGSTLSNAEYIAPRTETEKQLVAIWQELLQVEKVGVHDDFFELGGHSLLAVRLISTIRKELDIEITVRDIFTYTNIAVLGAYIDTLEKGTTLPSIVVQQRPKTVPLSFSQERLWFLDGLQGSLEYHMPFALRVTGNLDEKALSTSLKKVVGRHEVLRTVIYSEDGVAYQKVVPADNWNLSSKDLSGNTALLMEDLKAFLSLPFNLAADYMFRARLYRLGEREHVLAGNFHHISSDGWSQSILVKEFLQLYRSYSTGKDIELPPLSLQYMDYALWQRNHLEGTVIDKQLAYWENTLEGVPPLELPLDYPRPPVQSIAGANLSFELDSALSSGIRFLGKQEGTTVFMTLLAVFKILLSRYSGQSDICVGTPIANRDQKELEGIIGFFVNTLTLRTKITEDSSFKELLQSVKHNTLEAYDHQQVPFEKVVERVVKTRDMSMSPLFQVLFVLQNTQDFTNTTLDEIEGLTISALENQEQTSAKFDLTITIRETDKSFLVNFNYCTDLFKEETIQRMAKHFQQLIAAITDSPSSKLADLAMLTEEEEHLLLKTFNDTEVSYPKDINVVELFEKQTIKIPDATAVVYEGKKLSYGELDRRSNQLARYLMDKGVGPNVLVGVCLDRSPEVLVGLLGILKAGGAYIPIDPQYPQERIEYILEDSGVQLILSDSHNAAGLGYQEQLDILLLNTDWNDKIAKRSTNRPKWAIALHNIAYVIYTSGSTGTPKGVSNTHKGILNQILWTQDNYGLSPQDVVLQKTNFGFDVSVWELLWSLTTGAKLVLVRAGGQADVPYLKALIDEQQVTTVHFVPSMMTVFLAESSKGQHPSFKRVICSGEALTLEQVRVFRERFPELRLDNLYGPTEAGVHVSSWTLPKNGESLDGVPIGRPVANTKLYVLDERMRLLPMGAVGELCVGGDQVASGYLNREELTKEKFVDNPFRPGERIYRTGDLVRWMPDGNIAFIGRKDLQIKLRGYRIELGEIETALSLVPELMQACVIAQKDKNGNERLVGYIVTEGEPDTEKLQDILAKRLPEYMVPKMWVRLDEMPLNKNGKIDRRALPEPEGTIHTKREYVAPRTDSEEQLAEIWKELLGIERVGIYDNFFEMGGHSLLAVRLIAKARDIGSELRIRDIFSYPSIAQLVTKLSPIDKGYQVPENAIPEGCAYITPEMLTLVDLDQDEIEKIMDHVPGGATNIQDIYPLSPLQEGIHFHHMVSGKSNGDAYILPNLLSFSSVEKRYEFIEGLRFVIARHDVLRTCVPSLGISKNVQVVLREVVLPVEELTIAMESDILPQLEKEIAHENLYMDLSTAPMLRLKTADDKKNDTYYLVLNFHHLVTDHIGLEKVKKEIALYLTGRKDLLPAPSLYREFIGHILDEDKLKESKAYFSKLYEGISESTYPFNISDNDVDGSTTILSSKKMLPKGLKDTLRSVSGNLGISPAVLFHAAFGIVVAKCSGKGQALFGSLFLGRMQGASGSETSPGLFINTLPVLLEIKGDIPSYVRHVDERLKELLPHEQTHLSEVHDCSGIPNDRPMFSTLLNYRHSARTVQSVGNERPFDAGASYSSGGTRNNFPFNFDVDDYGDDFGLTAKLSDVGIDPSAVVAYMQRTLEILLEHMDKGSKTAVSKLSIIPKEERQRLLEVFNLAQNDYPMDRTVVDIFKQQAAATPDATALVLGADSLTYKELDERSNQLARFLISSGVKSNTTVGICMDPSLELLVGIMGILKSGGAYVPIDPKNPQERVQHMLTDAEVALLLSISANEQQLSFREDMHIIFLDRDWNKKISRRSINPPKREASKDDIAYLISTSGSTGTPKGVMVAHRSLTDYFYGITQRTNIASCRSFGLTSSVATDLGNTVIYTSLLVGGALHILSEDHSTNAHKISELEIDCLKMVPSHWKTLQSKDAICVPKKCLILGGEAFTDDVLDILVSNKVECQVYNHYGPTETTIGKLLHRVSLTEEYNGKVPLGIPFGNNRAYVIDGHGQLCPIGVIGELCIAGEGVAIGYFHQESRTKERFVSDPFQEGGRMYKTGDLARWISNGTIEFFGRNDSQVKVRGYRIELGEIENALSSVSGVMQSCVLARADKFGDRRLVAYIVMDGELDRNAIQEQLGKNLPEHMVPLLWVKLAEMPLTNNGKIDRKALPEPDSSELSTKVYVAPVTQTEKQLVEIWQELLGVEKVGIKDNFFELGGQSLLAIRLMARLQKLGYTVNIRDFYQAPSIAPLATKLSSLDSTYKVPENGIPEDCAYITPNMVPLINLDQSQLETIMYQVYGGVANIQDIYPLSPLQEGMYFHHLISSDTNGDPYVLPRLLSFTSPEKRTEFIAGLQFVIARHDVLRTCVLNKGLPMAVQVVLKEVKLPIEEISIDPNREILSQVQRTISPNNLYMDLTAAPLLKAKVADDIKNGTYYLVLHYHHMMMDHVGTEKIREEIAHYLSGREDLLPTPVLYRNFIGHTLEKERTGESKNYFSKHYRTVEVPSYPFNLMDTKINGSYRIITSNVMIPSQLGGAIRQLSSELRMSPATLFHAAFGIVVARCSGTETHQKG